MKPSLTNGLSETTTLTVDRERTIDFMGEQARVYATPMLVRDIEIACATWMQVRIRWARASNSTTWRPR